MVPVSAPVKVCTLSQKEAEALYDARHAAAGRVDKQFGDRWFAELNLLHLQEIGEHGLPDCYDKPEEFLYDFWPDLPWDAKSQRAVARLILDDPRFPAIRAAVQAATGLDMEHELNLCFQDDADE